MTLAKLRMYGTTTGLLLLLAAGAFLFRTYDLDARPMHTDEAVHAVKLGALLERGEYLYNSHEYHGPTHYYFALPIVRLTGARALAEIETSVAMRVVPAVFGTGLVLLPLLFAGGTGRRAAVFAGALAAVSPAFVFYGRCYIQEVLLVFFVWAAFGCGWRYVLSPRWGWALGAGTAAGFAQATKETAVISWACGAVAVGLTVVIAHGLERQHREPRTRLLLRHFFGALAIAAATAVLLLTNFLRNPAAAVDSVAAYTNYLGRAGTGDGEGTGAGAHVQPWYYYFRLLAWFDSGPGPAWSEGFVLLLAAVGLAAALRPSLLPDANRHLLRFLALYVMMSAVIYSTIPYKTPWNMLGSYYGTILLAGAGSAALLGAARGRVARSVVAAVLAAATAHLAWQAANAAFKFPADPRNPYVYGHTSTNLLKLVARVEDLAAVHPQGRAMAVYVVAPGDDYWPLPWYFRRYANAGFWNAVPSRIDAAPVIVAGAGLAEKIEPMLGDRWMQEFYGLRPDVLLSVFIGQELWQDYLRGQTAKR